ncbi:hypothetical protein VNO77_00230 [Canavalia gladiata]|uniref:Uncharacterized protein n=1 Tax=Canavalia gladiata TaxID=3824 RepID=A0AAN9MTS4_CANGL
MHYITELQTPRQINRWCFIGSGFLVQVQGVACTVSPYDNTKSMILESHVASITHGRNEGFNESMGSKQKLVRMMRSGLELDLNKRISTESRNSPWELEPFIKPSGSELVGLWGSTPFRNSTRGAFWSVIGHHSDYLFGVMYHMNRIPL